MPSLSDIVSIKERAEADLLQLPGVTGVDVGYKYVGGQRTDEISIRVLVAKKKKVVPKAEQVASAIGGVKTDVIERRFELHQRSNQKKVEDITLMADTATYDPVKGGISIGPCRAVGGYVYAGTLGVLVKDNATGNPLLLSNFHVMCIDNGWHVGDTMTQPSRVDTGACPANVVGSLQRASLTSSVDAAVCSLSGRGYACDIVDIGAVNGTATATLGAAVRKRGRTTGLTYGFVDSVSLTVKDIDYGDGIGLRTLTNQIGIRPDTAHNAAFGDHGDSGSVVVDDSSRVVGLYFAGGGGYGVANPISDVLSALNISICAPIKKIEVKEGKLEKFEVKEFKREKLEVKEFKREKYEIKEFKNEKAEIKDHKPEKFEVEGQKRIGDSLPIPPGGPVQQSRAIQPGPSGLEERISQLEAMVGQLATFITSEMRPDLSAGALMRESDLGETDLGAMRQQLEKNAADAAQAKFEFDTRPSNR